MDILLVGGGKMGRAMLCGWLRHASVTRVVLVDPVEPCGCFEGQRETIWIKEIDDLPEGFNPDAIVMAVKPQQLADTVPSCARFRQSVLLSVAAGKTLNCIEGLLGHGGHAVVRAMPNQPASIGQGMCVAVANAHVAEGQRKLCDALLAACGEVAWVDDEGLLDPATALSGCGPAYVFALVEAMSKAGESLGLSRAMADRLARQTVIGAGALLAQSADRPDVLINHVASPGGATEAALRRLMADGGLDALMHEAMGAAVRRAHEMAS